MTTPPSDTIDLSAAALESRQDGQLSTGRVHFAAGDVRRSSAWIFREWTGKDVQARFSEFSALELWRLLESLT